MILTSAAVVAAFGLALFALGQVTDNPGVALVGAIFIIGVGAAGATGGYQVADGETVIEYNNSSTNETVTDVETTYKDVETPQDLPLGVMVTLTGFVLFIGAAGRASES